MTSINRRSLLIGGAAALTAGALGASTNAIAAPLPLHPGGTLPAPSGRQIRRWAGDTWASLVAMTDERTGLTADNIDGPLAQPEPQRLHLTDQHRRLPVERDRRARSRADLQVRVQSAGSGRPCARLSRMRHHEPSGMYYNWYDEATGDVLTTWPTDGSPVYPFLSSVDNGWLAAALMVVQNADRATSTLAKRLSDRMNFAAFYNPDARPDLQVGLLRGGFWDGAKPPSETSAVAGNYLGTGPNVWYTGFHYDTTVSETRIASYIAIARGQVPAKHYFGTWRTFPDIGCDWSWQEQRPIGRPGTISASTSSRAPTPIGECGSCPVGAAPCSSR